MCHLPKINLCVLLLLGITRPTLADRALSSPAESVTRGMKRFRANQVDESIQDFRQAINLDPRVEPYLWQLGISYYYAEKFADGRRQFKIHQAVNSHDVENAAWHFLCVAREKGIETARRQLLQIDTARDLRVPMREIYQLYVGQGRAEEVTAAADSENTELARMYGNLYLGLYFEVAKESELARSHLLQAADAKLPQNYMRDVAKIHVLQRKWGKAAEKAYSVKGKTPEPPNR